MQGRQIQATASACAVVAVLAGSAAPAFGQDPGPSDLSVCQEKRRAEATALADVSEFARRLHGTWILKTRTIQGLTIDTDSRFYFDLANRSETEASGTAMMLDKGNLGILDPLGACKACEADAALGALWQVRLLGRADRGAISLSMAGDYVGSYGDFRKGIKATESASFIKNGDSYFAGSLSSPAGGQGVPDDVWDRIGLTRDSLVYVSCRGGFIDRFEKLADERPLIGGLTLAQAWEQVKQAGWLLNPPRVRPGRP
jgi:hypothetical protein